MTNRNDLWEQLGDIETDDITHVLTTLFSIYEEKIVHNPDDTAAISFFKHLHRALSQVGKCNLNRR